MSGKTLAYQISVNMTLTLDHAPAMHSEQVKAAVAMMWQTMREQKATAAGQTYVESFADGNIVFQTTPIVEVEVPQADAAEEPGKVH